MDDQYQIEQNDAAKWYANLKQLNFGEVSFRQKEFCLALHLAVKANKILLLYFWSAVESCD